jgi:hypothetical protein
MSNEPALWTPDIKRVTEVRFAVSCVRTDRRWTNLKAARLGFDSVKLYLHSKFLIIRKAEIICFTILLVVISKSFQTRCCCFCRCCSRWWCWCCRRSTPRFLWNPKFVTLFTRNQHEEPYPKPDESNPQPPKLFRNNHFNIILQSAPNSSSGPLPSCFLTKCLYVSLTCVRHAPPISSSLIWPSK